jgi:hypothetical protein
VWYALLVEDLQTERRFKGATLSGAAPRKLNHADFFRRDLGINAAPLRAQISVLNPPLESNHPCPPCKSEGVFDYQNWGLAMGPVHSPHGLQGRPERASREVSRLEGSSLERSGFDGDEDGFDEYTDDDVVSLLEENARLRKLVIRLSELVLRNVVDGK